MTFESDVAAISSRTHWVRARDRSESTGTALRWFLDYDGAVVTVAKWDIGSGPKVSTASPPTLSTKSFLFNVAMPFATGRVVMTGIVDVFASSSLSGADPAMAFNGSNAVGEFWANPGASLPAHVGAQFGTGFAATGYTLYGRTDTPSQTPKDWTFQGSNDGSSWTTLDTRTGQTSPNGTNYTFSNATSYTYYRINVSAVQSGNLVAISSLDIDGAPHRNNHAGSSGEVWIVRKTPTAGTNVPGPNQTGTGSESYVPLSDGKVYYTFGSSARSDNITMSPAVTWSNWHILRMVKRSTGVVELWFDGVLKHTANSGAAAWSSTIFLGGSASGSNSGEYQAEWIHFNAELSSGDVTKVSDYLTDTHFSAVTPPATTGAGAVTAPTPTVSGAGTSTVTGSAAVTAPAPAGSGAGTSTVTGSGAVTAPAPVGSGTGTADDTTFGVGAVTAPAPTAAGAGTSTVTGVGDVTAPAPTGSGSATSTVTGTGAVTAPTPTVTGAGTFDPPGVSGSGAVTAPQPTVNGSGSNGAGAVVVCLTFRPVGVVTVSPLVPTADPPNVETLTRYSVQAPVLTAEYQQHPALGEAGAPTVTKGTIGTVHLWIGGRDVTYLRDTPTIIRRWASEAPFGDTVAAFEFPQLNPWDRPGTGDLDFLVPDAPVKIGIVNDGVVRYVWQGFLDARGTGTAGEREDYTWEAKGLLWQAQHRDREPYPYTQPMDIGILSARVLNAVEGRRWRTIPWEPIGITTLTRGSSGDKAMEFEQRILSEAIGDDGRQWTLDIIPNVGPRHVQKPAASEVHATFAYGTPGIECDLRVDESTRIDRVFARGIGPGAAGWRNVFFPRIDTLQGLDYPNADPGDLLGLGTTDAATTTGTGVTDFQRRVDELQGFDNPPVSGVMSPEWMAIIDDLQRFIGANVDGIPGPETWQGLFDRIIDLSSEALVPVRLPVASKSWANKYLYNAAGARRGLNPNYDPTKVVRDVDINMGAGQSKAQGRKWGRKVIEMYGEAARYGTIVFTFDPNETDRTTISHLSNIKVLGWEGEDVTVQVASKEVVLEEPDISYGGGSGGNAPKPIYVVTCRVDEHQRDAMYVEDLLEQRRSAEPDMSRRPGPSGKSSRAIVDERMPWDSESPCGVLRRTAVAAGQWKEIILPFAEVGKIARINLTSDQPFMLGIFASLRITEPDMQSLGDPWAADDFWRDNETFLAEYGYIEAFGMKDQACGYSPKVETSMRAGTSAGPFTGKFVLDTPIDYWTETPPFVKVMVRMRGGSGYIQGNFFPAYER